MEETAPLEVGSNDAALGFMALSFPFAFIIFSVGGDLCIPSSISAQWLFLIFDCSADILHVYLVSPAMKSKKISNDQELIQSDPISCPQNQKGNN